MAAVELSVELHDPDKVYLDGEKIRGEIVVRSEKNVTCRALMVSTSWSTHGRGNVDRSTVEETEVFSGAWQAGQQYRYPFELSTASWPPTHYGNYLNVSHVVQAQAKLAWAFDPKASVEFVSWATQIPEDGQPQRAKGPTPLVLKLIGATLGIVLLGVVGMMFLFLVPVLLIAGGGVWFFRSYLPRSRTGKVECLLEPLQARPGETIRGTMRFTPQRKLTVNEVGYRIVCEEKCVSGSGSNRTTHRHEVVNEPHTLVEAAELLPGTMQAFEFEYRLPPHAPPSLDLSDNDIHWHVEYRIDIPRWPDFARKLPFRVGLGPHRVSGSSSGGEQTTGGPPARAPSVAESWLTQVAEQLRVSKEDPQRRAIVLEAIAEDDFQMEVLIEEEVGRPAEAADRYGGAWFAGVETQSEENVIIHFSGGISQPPVHQKWQGRAAIIGFIPNSEQLICSAFSEPPRI